MMAYNYYPPTYQGYQQPQQYQNPFQTLASQPVVSQPQQMILWVDGDEEAAAFPLAPNNAVRLWHKTKPMVYFKSADASGRQMIEKYDLVKHVDVPEPVIEYAVKADLDALREEIKAIHDRLEAK